MGEARRIPASEKAPADFLPPILHPVLKSVAQVTVTRKTGEVETFGLILRPGDVATLNGKTIMEG